MPPTPNNDPSEFDNLASLGATGLRRSGGWIDEEYHRLLRGRRGVQTYREMSDNDPVVGALLYAISTLVRNVEWWVEPSDEASEAAVAEAEFVEGASDDMAHTFEDLVDEILSMLVYGWSYFELCYKLRKGDDQTDPTLRSAYTDGRFGWRKIEIRGQDSLDRWELDEDGGIRGMWQAADSSMGLMSPVFIPIEKALLFRPRRHKNNPEGRSVLRTAVRPWFMLKRIQEIEAVGVERDLAGLPMFEVPPEILSSNATPEQKALRQMLETLIQQIRRDEREGLIVPASERTAADGVTYKTGYKFSLVTSGGRRQLDTNGIITRYEQRILMSCLAEFLMLGMQDVGSRSLASSKTTTFAASLGALLNTIASVLNRFAIPRLEKLNQVPRTLWPHFVHGDVETPPLEELGAFVTSLANAGFLLADNKPLERKLLGYAKLPPSDDEEPTEAAGPQPGTLPEEE